LEFESVDFLWRRKTGGLGEKPSWQGREPTNNSTHMKYPLPTAVRGERLTATPPMPPKYSLAFKNLKSFSVSRPKTIYSEYSALFIFGISTIVKVIRSN
jgi:hypothetical protein